MRIGIDISTLINHGSDIGAGRYIVNLLESLFQIDRHNTYVLTGRYTTEKYLGIPDELIKKHTGTKIELKLFGTTQEKLEKWDEKGSPTIESLGFESDIIHCPDYVIPPTINENIVLTIHDLGFIRFPGFNFEWFVKKYSKMVKKNAKRAKLIMADSISTKNDIVDFFKVDPDKIEVLYLAADSKFRKLPGIRLNRRMLKKYDISGSFILSVGTIEPRKNYAELIRIYNRLRSEDPQFNHKLVIVGRTGWKSEETFEQRNKSIFKKDIHFPGRIPDDDLLQVYNQADVLAYPSIFEGFGLPVVEAMKCGLPVITFNNSSLKEIVGGGGILVENNNSDLFGQNITKIINDRKFSDKISRACLAQADRFSWNNTARRVLAAYENLL